MASRKYLFFACVWIVNSIIVVNCEEDGPKLYGSEEALSSVLSSGGRRAWLDPNVELPAGTVLSFVAYIGEVGSSDAQTPLAVRFQVWTNEGEDYVLKWEKRVEVSEGNKKIQIELSEDELVVVTSHDYIGFTCEQKMCPVSYKNIESYKVKFDRVTEFPAVGQNVGFRDNYPAQFAFGVYIGTPQFGSVVYSGNPVVKAKTENTGQRTWIDSTVTLSTGLVNKLEFYAAQPQGTNVRVMVQVWYPRQDEFMLLWQREVVVDNGQGKYTVAVPGHESVVVNGSCHLGWTYPDGEGPIYYTFDRQHSSKYHDFSDEESDAPTVGEAYVFDLDFPNRFSIGLWIDTGITQVPPNDGESNAAGAATSVLAAVSVSSVMWIIVTCHALL